MFDQLFLVFFEGNFLKLNTGGAAVVLGGSSEKGDSKVGFPEF